MGLVDVGTMFYPDPTRFPGGSITKNAADLRFQASTTKIARLMQVPHWADGLEVDEIYVQMGNTPTANELRAGLYTVDSATGAPTTTGYDGGGDNYGSASVSANSLVTIALSRNVTLTAGEWLAIVFEPNDGDAVDMYLGSVSSFANSFGRTPQTWRYVASWATSAFIPALGIKTTTGLVLTEHRSILYSSVTPINYNTGTGGTTGDENALKLTIPFTCRVTGLYFSNWPIGGNREFILYYNNDASSKSTGTIDNEFIGASTLTSYFFFDAPVTLTAGDLIRICQKPTSGSNTYQYKAVFPDSSWVTQFGVPSGACRSYRADSGSWNDVTDEIVIAGLIIDQLDDGTGGGSGGLPIGRIISGGV